MFTSKKKRKQLENTISELRSKQKHLKHIRDQYQQERNQLREDFKTLKQELNRLRANTLHVSQSDEHPICVLGMHRSGTSCLTGCLQEIGVFLGEVVEKSDNNKKGNRESRPIRSINNRLLTGNGGEWMNPPTEIHWDDKMRIQRNQVLQAYSELDSLWGFKDPRTIFTLPFWQEAIPQLRFIGTFRHPMATAASLHARTPGISIEDGLGIWLRYNKKILEIHNETPFPILSFDLNPKTYQKAFFKAASQLSISYPDDLQTLSFFDSNLRHQKTPPDSSELSPEVLETYAHLSELTITP